MKLARLNLRLIALTKTYCLVLKLLHYLSKLKPNSNYLLCHYSKLWKDLTEDSFRLVNHCFTIFHNQNRYMKCTILSELDQDTDFYYVYKYLECLDYVHVI